MRFLVFFISFFYYVHVFAAGPAFSNLSQSDFDNITKEISSNFSHISLIGPAVLGKSWDFELSLAGGVNPSPYINSIVKSATGNTSDMPNLYHGGLVLGMSTPLGITAEIVYLPKSNIQGVNVQFSSWALKWTLGVNLWSYSAINLAIRVCSSYSNLSFYENSGSISGTVENVDTVSGAQFLISPESTWVEPYLGLGILSANDVLSINGTGTIFNTTVTSGQTGTSQPTSAQTLVGINLKLSSTTMGLEYAQSFGSSRYTAKLGFLF